MTFEAKIEFDNLDDLKKSSKINTKGLIIQQQYRNAIDKWEKCLRSNKNNKYAERSDKCVKKNE
jgi:hypothetical protein